jgi:hypothetical protein
MGRINNWKGIILDTIFYASIVIGMRVFEYKMEYRGYMCPQYCGIDHEHITENDRDMKKILEGPPEGGN